ncbi:hypothetical protein [Streptomyces flaveus]|uniref:hypothetical protein n=1 Tax=Streptomyces flaveus TaxID=66370 RepID=UPI00332EF272
MTGDAPELPDDEGAQGTEPEEDTTAAAEFLRRHTEFLVRVREANRQSINRPR